MKIDSNKISPDVINVVTGLTWVSGLVTAWLLADKHPYLAFASIFFSFTARLRLPERKI